MSYDQITARIADACQRHARPPGSVHLIAVSKVQPDDRVRDVLRAGHRLFGENYVQEAQAKWPGFRAEFGPVAVHMIGPLQTNKAKVAVARKLAILLHKRWISGEEYKPKRMKIAPEAAMAA